MTPAVSTINSQYMSAFTFIAKLWQTEAVSSNGLPLTANSISIFGRFQILKSFRHDNLTQYLNIERGKHGKSKSYNQVKSNAVNYTQKGQLSSASFMDLH